MRRQLFDRFESADDGDLDGLAYDIADILGARRAIEGDNLPGVLKWGLPGMIGLSPQVDSDRRLVAGYIKDALLQFEPRLKSVDVIPTEGSNDFSFQLKAEIIDDDNEQITLRIITPRRGGGLGAEIAVIGGTSGKTAVFKNDEEGDS